MSPVGGEQQSRLQEINSKNYLRRVKDDVKSILDNFTSILSASKVKEESQLNGSAQSVMDRYEMHVRSSNITRAAESLVQLIDELKESLILDDFTSLNEANDAKRKQFEQYIQHSNSELQKIKHGIGQDLQQLETEYYNSAYK
ncbi:Mediator of RNA polymerase II transcription subunit 22 [Trichoplax sp. H2]|uniref:Mediator of RNA polymerase II transcription subunit 22 n=1 Tax=Trichoplax adhaerens TaxID=10228 RepID=B3RP06_TRIAD|nr:hypothetical protein TRIADDRAFT_53358 [Trichoplax adhaerens]EDV27549.1 hypothetical protein TRIADDRAFT_53358 [Trichoplax adhaerens]RDD43417.1 Mediator of RNA polymerase II transcription subunit 22 [Trichoplax sp. H2]|eukprot:XP_002109383.1 hypothetical protein TRIADDRAFT_53358 [Trichoplax adhaerens]